ncbi:MAG: aldose epimerase family protein [Bacteroidota bacterium]
MSVSVNTFGQYLDQPVFCVALSNENGVKAEFLSYGATWHSYTISDNNNNPIDVIVAPNTLEGYLTQYDQIPYFFGNIVGRYAGRINCNGVHPFLKSNTLSNKDGVQLHGGVYGFARQNWIIKHLEKTDTPSVTFAYNSPHLEEGYPGEMTTTVTYTLHRDNTIEIVYSATSDRDTLVNLTNHAYFNLGEKTMTTQHLYLDSEAFLATTSNQIPTGQRMSTPQTLYDFMDYPSLESLTTLKGLDHVFLLKESPATQPKIKLHSKSSGLEMAVHTDQPAVVIFAPQALHFAGTPKNSAIDYSFYPAICLETQLPPDSMNHSHFPEAILRKGDKYSQRTEFKFRLA